MIKYPLPFWRLRLPFTPVRPQFFGYMLGLLECKSALAKYELLDAVERVINLS